MSHSSFSQGDSAYIFSYFINNGEDGLHLAYSKDALHWLPINDNESILTPVVGKDKLMRDPCLIIGRDGYFHMVWTVSWGEKGIGYAKSKDLINWSDQRFLPVMKHEEEALNCWAPELFYDEISGEYMIYWSTTIPGKFPQTDHTGDKNYNHRMYYTTTKDFEDFSPVKLLFDDGFNVIDGVIKKVGGEFYMIVKDETKRPTPMKNLRLTKSLYLHKGYSNASQPFSVNWVEGPTIIKLIHSNEWILYYDEYTRHKMGALKTTNWQDWENISDQISFPKGLRHGTALKVPNSILNNLKRHYRK